MSKYVPAAVSYSSHTLLWVHDNDSCEPSLEEETVHAMLC